MNLLYSLVIIRLNKTTRIFENTELHATGLSKEKIIGELRRNGANPEDIADFSSFTGGRMTKTVESDNKIWFYYISH